MSQDESFFREVDEDYQRERMLKFLEQYGVYMLAAAFIIIAVVAGYTLQRQRAASQAAASGDEFSAALNLIDGGKKDEGRKALDAIVQTGRAPYRYLAKLQLAAESADSKNIDAAKSAYRDVAGDAAAPNELRDYARLQLAALSLDSMSYGQLAQDLGEFRSGNGPWRFQAKELLGLAAWRDGKKEEAERLFGEIVSDGEAPQGMRQRADIMLALILEKPSAQKAAPTAKGDTPNDSKTQ
jgi:hypothetical protein